jgi:hypothetical protein
MKLLSFFKVRKNTGIILKTCIQCGERKIKDYKCPDCDYKSSTNGNLQQHIIGVHNKIKNFECTYPDCDYKCSANGNLQKHIKFVHDKIKDFECPDCDYKSSTNENLKKHINGVHNKIKNFECPDCDFKSSTNGNLQQHIIRVHNKIKNFECTYPDCDYKCSANGHLQRHIKFVHDKIKDFECPDCDFKCSANENLKKHIKGVHNKIKNFECPDCDFKCSTNSHLQRHIKICTGLRNISSGEFKMIECLEELGFHEDEDYRHNSSFSELTTSCGKRLRFDFMFINHKRVFEYDGEQHIRPVKFGGMSQEQAEENFQKTVENDKLKDDFCKNNGYKMVRISYKDYPNILSILHGELLDIMDNVG